MFGRREISKRERGGREVGERWAISHVWYRRESEQRDTDDMGPTPFSLLSIGAKKQSESTHFFLFSTILPGYIQLYYLSFCFQIFVVAFLNFIFFVVAVAGRKKSKLRIKPKSNYMVLPL